MIVYGISKTGQYHIEREEKCQDSLEYKMLDDGTIVAAVADGVGSEKYSEFGSRIAVNAFVKYCSDCYYDQEDKSILIKNGFLNALYSVLDESESKNYPIDQMDSTLCGVIFSEGILFCGNIGDSGIIGINSDGRIECLTTQHNDEDGSVYPLRCEKKWEFSQYHNIISILIATDGFYNYLFPKYLEFTDYYKIEDRSSAISYDIVNKLIDTNNHYSEDTLMTIINNTISSIPTTPGIDSITDDLTILCIISAKEHPIVGEYNEPINRKDLKDKYTKHILSILYPKNDKTNSVTDIELDKEHCILHEEEQFSSTCINHIDLSEICKDLSKIRSDPNFDTYEFDQAHILNFYKDVPTTEIISSLERMILQPDCKCMEHLEWPTSILTEGSYTIGFIATRYEKYRTLNEFNLNELDVDYRVQIAFNLTILVKEMHSHNIIAGAILPWRVGITKEAYVYLTSFGNCDTEQISEDVDDLSLAKMIFILLTNTDNIIEYEQFDNISDDKLRVFEGSFPDYLVCGFKDVFLHGMIIPASKWYELLNRYSIDIKRCDCNPSHIYYRNSIRCPYCTSKSNSINR